MSEIGYLLGFGIMRPGRSRLDTGNARSRSVARRLNETIGVDDEDDRRRRRDWTSVTR